METTEFGKNLSPTLTQVTTYLKWRVYLETALSPRNSCEDKYLDTHSILEFEPQASHF